MDIREVKDHKKQYIDLLLLADEQEDMVDRYLDRGRMYILINDGKVRSECVITYEVNRTIEIKNLATYPVDQGKGYAKKLINYNIFRKNIKGIINSCKLELVTVL